MRRQHRPIGPRGSSSLGRRVPPRPGLIATCALTAALALAACSSVGTGAPPVTGTTGAASTPSTTSPEPTPSTTSPQPTPSTTSASRSGPGQGATALPSTSTDGTEIATAGGETPCPVAAATFVTRAPGAGKTVALTFDDGPGPATLQIVAVLRSRGVRATFFDTGAHAQLYPAAEAAEAAAAAAGNVVGNHSFDHVYPQG